MLEQSQVFTVPVEGMTCSQCEITVTRAILKAGGRSAQADFKLGQATFELPVVNGNINATVSVMGVQANILNSIKAAGYWPGQIASKVLTQEAVRNQNLNEDSIEQAGAAYDLVIIGSGGAAFAAAITATELGKRVLMIERGVVGGTCVNIGCIPSKTLLRAGETYYNASHQPFGGLQTQAVSANLAQLVAQKNELVGELRAEKYENLISEYGWELERGEAYFVSQDTVAVNGRTIRAEAFLIATGARPAVPLIPGLEEAGYLTSTTALELKELPRSLAIIGAGYIALELGQFFHHLGVQVTLLQRSARFLKKYDPEIAAAMQEVLERQGIRVITSTQIKRIEKNGEGGWQIVCSINGQPQVFEAGQILVATGRQPNTSALNLDLAGVKTDQTGAIITDQELKTANPRIWAAGDVTAGAKQFVYVAAYAGKLVAQNALNKAGHLVDFSTVPAVTFTTPQIATVGLTEAQARAAGIEVSTAVLPLKAVPRALVNHNVEGVFKLVSEVATGRVLGVHIVAENAGEVIYAGTLAVKFKLTIEDLTSTFAPYLTMAEGLKLAAQSFNQDVSKLSCCAA